MYFQETDIFGSGREIFVLDFRGISPLGFLQKLKNYLLAEGRIGAQKLIIVN
jgi:hypothetical protein